MIETARLTERDFRQLDDLLASPELARSMRLDEAQGYLCAALAGPQAIEEAQWLAEVLGDADPERCDVARQATVWLRRLARELEADLAAGTPLARLRGEQENGPEAGNDRAAWALAYLHGVETSPVDWFDALGAEDDSEASEEVSFLDEQLFPFFMLSGEAEAAAAEAGEEWPSGAELDRLRQECEDLLPQAVTDIYRFWLAQRSRRTIRRATAKIGRNDACPCGSGRKYKKCCATV